MKMAAVEAYDVKARKMVSIIDPESYHMKNGKWAIKGKSSETGITVFKIVGANKPKLEGSRLNSLKRAFRFSRY